MHFKKIGKNLKAIKRLKMKQYLATKMKLYIILLNKYGSKAISDF